MRRRPGDVYRISLSAERCAFMQHLTNDASQLGGNVVLVIPLAYPANEAFKVEQMAHDGFFAHVFLKAGETLNIWARVQWIKPVITEIPVTWAVCSEKDLQLEVSHNWRVWRTNEKWRLPVNEDELANAELGLVMSPPRIVERIERSAYSIKYPRKGPIERRQGVFSSIVASLLGADRTRGGEGGE